MTADAAARQVTRDKARRRKAEFGRGGDILVGTACALVPGVAPWGPGFYLIAANERVEAGPFRTQAAALMASLWLDDNAMGTHPGPWFTRYSHSGLEVGSRLRAVIRSPELLRAA